MGVYSTVGSWAGVIAVGAGYWYLTKDKGQKATKVVEKITAKTEPKKKEAKQKAKKATGVDASASSADQSEKTTKKRNKKAKATKEPAAVTQNLEQTTHDDDDEAEEQTDIREFARAMSNAKSGITAGDRPSQGSRQKSVKQSRAAGSGFSTSEADDESGVADMLETPAVGPSVLRVTAPTNAQPKKEKKAAKAPEPVETKKQRQNRQKKEAEQAARAEAEAQRKVLEEQQRRTARLAEGRAAKDGSSSAAARAAAASVWKDKGPEVPAASSTNGHVQLLDTVSAPAPAKISQEYSALPSEEEQIRQIEQEEEWATVSKPKKNKAKKTEENVKPVEEAAPVKKALVQPKYEALSQRQQTKKNANTNGFAIFGQDTKLETANLAVVDNSWPVSQ